MPPDQTVLDPTQPPAAVPPTVAGRQPGASNPDGTTDRPSDADPARTTGGDFTPSMAGDPGAATGSFDPAAAPPPSGPVTLRKRPLPTVPGYAIHGVLGRGGMGVVYRATQEGLGRQVALKMVLSGGHASAAQLERFGAEARAVAHVRHPNIVQIYDIGEHDGLPYFSLEMCPGGSLDKLLHHEPQAPEKAAALLEKLARGMFAAHSANIIHRDLKPANVLLDEHGEPKITDFGLAKELGGADGNTRTGSILGTPSYMAPEQARGDTKGTGPAADQYSLGATLYDLLTGRPPFQGTSVMETLEAVRTREPVSPRELQPGLPRDLETITLKALAKDADKRYPTCGALADDLRAFLEGRPISARPVGGVEKAWRWAKRNPGVATPSAVAAVLLLATAALGTTFAVVFDQQKREAVTLAGDLQVSLVAEQAAKQVAEVKQKEADGANALTQSALQKVGVDAPAELRRSLYGGRGRLAVLDLIGGVLAGQLDPANSAKLPDRARFQYHDALGRLLNERDGAAAAEPELVKALALAETLATTDAVTPGRARATLARSLFTLANVDESLGRLKTSDERLARAEAVIRDTIADPACGDVPLADRRLILAEVLGAAADRQRSGGYFAKSLVQREEQVTELAAVVDDPAAAADSRRRAGPARAEAVRQRGRVKAKLGQDPAAEADFKEAVRQFAALDADARKARRPDDRLTRGHAAAVGDLADFLLVRDRLAEAAGPHLTLVALNRQLVNDPEVVAQRRRLADAYYQAGTLGLRKNGVASSLPFYRPGWDIMKEVAAATPGGPNRRLADLSVAYFAARCGDHAAAVKVVPWLVAGVSDPNNQAEYRRRAAEVYSLAAGAAAAKDPATAAAYRDRAFGHLDWMLGKPVAWADPVRLRTDPDYEPIRADPRFAACVARAEANQAARAAAGK